MALIYKKIPTLVELDENIPTQFNKSICLVGWSGSDWHKEVFDLLKEHEYDGVVFDCLNATPEQYHSIEERVNISDAIIFWDPSSKDKKPSINFKFDKVLTSEKLFYGTSKIEYLGPKAELYESNNSVYKSQYLSKNEEMYEYLEDTITSALEYIGEGYERENAECYLPLYIWNLKEFQLRYLELKDKNLVLEHAIEIIDSDFPEHPYTVKIIASDPETKEISKFKWKFSKASGKFVNDPITNIETQLSEFNNSDRSTQQILLEKFFESRENMNEVNEQIQKMLMESFFENKSSINEVVTEVKEHIQKTDDKVEFLQFDTEAKLQQLNSNVSKISNNTYAIKESNEQAITNVMNKLEMIKEDSKQSKDELTSNINALNEANTKAQDEIKQELQSMKEDSTQSRAKLTQEIQTIKDEASASKSELIQELQTINEDADKTRSDLAKKLVQLQETTNFATASIEDLSKDISKHQAIIKDIRKEYSDIHSMTEGLTNSIDNVSSDNQKLRNKVDNVQQRIITTANKLSSELNVLGEDVNAKIDKVQEKNKKDLDKKLKKVTDKVVKEVERIDDRIDKSIEDTNTGLKKIDDRIQESENRLGSIEHWKAGTTKYFTNSRNQFRQVEYTGGGSDGWRPQEVKEITSIAPPDETTVVDSFINDECTAVRWDYSVTSSNNVRTGSVMAVWDGTGNIEYHETCTNDIGDTGSITFDVIDDSGTIKLRATVAPGADTYSVRLKRYKI